jgi:protein-S-isoprenylcysteine O-methyltransferase Ste14
MRDSLEKQTGFNRQYNISYLDPKLPRATFKQVLRHYVASAIIYGVVLLLLNISPWFIDLLRVPLFGYPALFLYRYVYVAYLIIAPLIYFVVRPRSLWMSKNLLILGYFRRLARWCIQSPKQRIQNAWRPAYEEKHAMMFLLIKTFYGPLMINSALMSYYGLVPFLQRFRVFHSLLSICDTGYMVLFHCVFLLDSSMFAFGYHSESGLLKNKLRYAETNPLHILVCVACYSPFNMATGAFFGPSNRDPYILFAGDVTHPLTWVLRGLGVFFLLLLLSTSMSLFTKASNLTNRGIVDWGPYRIVRHPGYLAKNMFWLMTLLPTLIPDTSNLQFTWSRYLLFFTMTVWGFVGWGTLYFLRAITEEKFLMRDPDYVAYCRKVKYRFIPGVY